MSAPAGVRRLVAAIVTGDNRSRPRATWRVLLPFVLVIGLGIAVTAVLARFDLANRLGAGLVSDVLLALVVGTVLVVTARYLDERPLPDYGFRLSRRWWTEFGAGSVLGVVLVAAVFATSYALGGVVVVETVSPGDAGSFALWFLLSGLGYLCTAFWEETLFRGILITNAAEGLAARGLSPRDRLVGALVVSTVVFGAVHGPLGTVPGESALVGMLAVWTLMGGLLGLAYVLSGELAFPMGLHFTVNYAFNNVFFGPAVAGAATLPAVLRTEVLAPALWHPFSGLPMIATVLLGYALTIGWYARRDGGLTPALSVRERPAEG